MSAKKQYLVSFIPINRSLFTHFLWKESRTFSKCEAWLDLIQSARFEQSQAKELVGGRLMTWGRGQLPASVRFLAYRWNWSKHKVDDFLKLLEKEAMIKIDSSQGQTLITLLNYLEHNLGQQKGHVNKLPERVLKELMDTEGDKRGTATGQAGDETNKDNKVNNEEEEGGVPPPPPKSFKNFTREDFIEEIRKHEASFSKEMRNDFFKYWSEKNPKGKMKFQLQDTWETNLRLETWASKQQNFSKNANSGINQNGTGSTPGKSIVFDKA